MFWVLSILGGMLVGLTLGLIGGGGSILAMPMMAKLLGDGSTHIAIGTAAVAVTSSALVNLALNARSGLIKWRCTIVFALSGVAGAAAGAWLGQRTDGAQLLVLFGALMIGVGLLMLRPRKSPGNESVRLEFNTARILLPRLAGLGIGTGMVSGFFGIGGGFLIVPALQEISRNPDTLSITPAHTQIQASWIDKTSRLTNFQSTYINQVDMSLHAGNKPLNTNGLKRMRDFCQFVFSPSCPEQYVVVGGHSIWFRSFFQTFLPYGDNHVGKKKKIVNCGVVAITLIKATRPSGQATYMIDPQSVEVIYGGFH
ncbi:MAG: sulfite exporter TauE/SafE family protein [Caldilineaceae bacterium]|nr:sulfite exporter TauE/SafE family protein [Caldilineaceae bacterium]